jgi:hypothetical protein
MHTGELVGHFSTDNDGRSFFYGPIDPMVSRCFLAISNFRVGVSPLVRSPELGVEAWA